MTVWLAVRHHDDLFGLQLFLDHLLQGLRCPVLAVIDLAPLSFFDLAQHLAHLRKNRLREPGRPRVLEKAAAANIADQQCDPAPQQPPGEQCDDQCGYADKSKCKLAPYGLVAAGGQHAAKNDGAKRRMSGKMHSESRG